MGNTEGSQVIPHVYKARKNLELKLTNNQLSIIIGSIIGDAYVYPQGKICFEHSQYQKDYLDWKYLKLKKLAYPKISKVVRIDKRYQKKNLSFRFFLKQYFRPLRHLFYSQNTKVIPEILCQQFNALSMAVWYMDDGCLEKGKSPVLATESYHFKEIQLLADLLKGNFSIECSISSNGRLRVIKKDVGIFFHLIEPWIIPSMRYKLP